MILRLNQKRHLTLTACKLFTSSLYVSDKTLKKYLWCDLFIQLEETVSAIYELFFGSSVKSILIIILTNLPKNVIDVYEYWNKRM